MRDATAQGESSDTNETVATTSDGQAERVQKGVDIQPRGSGTNTDDGMVRVQTDGIDARHVNRDAAIDICKPGRGGVRLAFDGELTVAGVHACHGYHRGSHIIRGKGCDNALRDEAGFLDAPVGV